MSERDPGQRFVYPSVTFSTFIVSLASSALVGLGEVPDPSTGATSRDLDFVRHNIDILEMLKSKTQGRLDADESGLLDNILNDLRIKYIIFCDKKG